MLGVNVRDVANFNAECDLFSSSVHDLDVDLISSFVVLFRNTDSHLCRRKKRTAEDQDCAELSHRKNLKHRSIKQRFPDL